MLQTNQEILLYEKIKPVVASDENLLYVTRPEMLSFFLRTLFGPLFPIAAICSFLFLPFFMYAIQSELSDAAWFFFPLLTPLWIYLWRLLMVFPRYKSTYYAITNKKVYAIYLGKLKIQSSIDITKNLKINVYQSRFYRQHSLAGDIHIDSHQGNYATILKMNCLPDCEKACLIIEQTKGRFGDNVPAVSDSTKKND